MRQGLNSFAFESIKFMEEDGSESTFALQDYAVNDAPATISLRFFNLIEELAARIEESVFVVGCCPWFSSPRIRAALGKIRGFSIVTSFEEGQPTTQVEGMFPIELVEKLEWDSVIFAFKDWNQARCVENILSVGPKNGYQAVQRLHSKFMVFVRRDQQGELTAQEFVVGSANFTANADRQLELLCFINSPKACDSMLLQWYQMLMIAGYQRDKELLQFGAQMTQVEEWNTSPDWERYPYDVEAGLFDALDYISGKRSGI
ncbi:hypothetical protein [Rhizobium sp. NPDC090279]|uniref:hypothetical protein n=1 Tax=Rhizobium sp. NPDC090279 TaxID=3364499 RepID=UPI00383B246E